MLLAAWYHPILATLFAFLAFLLMGVILLQRGKGVGLSGAFGGAGGATAFGSKTGDVLTWATIVIAGIFLLYVVILSYIFVPMRATAPAAVTPVPANSGAPAGNPTPQPAGGGPTPLFTDALN